MYIYFSILEFILSLVLYILIHSLIFSAIHLTNQLPNQFFLCTYCVLDANYFVDIKFSKARFYSSRTHYLMEYTIIFIHNCIGVYYMPHQRSVRYTGDLELSKKENLHRRGPQASGCQELVGGGSILGLSMETPLQSSRPLSHTDPNLGLWKGFILIEEKAKPSLVYLPLSSCHWNPKKWPEVGRICALEESSVACREPFGLLTLSCHRHKSPGWGKGFTPSSKKGYLFAGGRDCLPLRCGNFPASLQGPQKTYSQFM